MCVPLSAAAVQVPTQSDFSRSTEAEHGDIAAEA
jgi:hypothetical protein